MCIRGEVQEVYQGEIIEEMEGAQESLAKREGIRGTDQINGEEGEKTTTEIIQDLDQMSLRIDLAIRRIDLARRLIDLPMREIDLTMRWIWMTRREINLDRREIDLDRREIDLDRREIDLDRRRIGMAKRWELWTELRIKLIRKRIIYEVDYAWIN
jgi:hypothetical protein